MIPDQIVLEARRWVGTPYKVQGRRLGVAVDCVGLFVEVARSLGLPFDDECNYPVRPADDRWAKGFMGQLVNLGAPYVGGAAIIGWSGKTPQHCGILTREGTIIHAYSRPARCIEHRFASVLRAKVIAWMGFKGLTYQEWDRL